MGIIAICLVSFNGETGCVVKSSFVSYQRINVILDSFKSIIEDTRISCKSANNSTLGGKRIEDIYPLSQPIPLVIGSYRLLYQLLNDFYVITIDLDHHSPFLSLDVMEKTKEVIYQAMEGDVRFANVEVWKIKFYYSFRRCINGIEGVSTLNLSLRQIRLANDPMVRYTNNNSLEDINDILHPGEISAEVREFTRDAWETVLHFEGRIPADAKKEIKAGLKKRKLDEFFDIDCELEGHQVPDLAETVTTPMAELIVDQEYNAEEALKPLTSIQSALSSLPKTVTTFATDETVAIKSATEAIIEPFVDVLTPVATDEVAANEEEEDDAEEEINVEGQDAIHVDVPGKTVAVDDNTTPVPAGDEEVEELNVIQLDGTVTETLKIEQDTDGFKKQVFKGELVIKPIIPDGIPEGKTAAHITILNATGITFKPEEGLCKLIDDGESSKTFEVTLPTNGGNPEGTHVLTYLGRIPDQNIPCSAEALSSREGTITSAKITAHCNECELQSTIEELSAFLSPPLLSKDPNLKRTFRIKPKGGFMKASQKIRWTDQFMEENQDYSFGAEITEPVELGDLPPIRDAEFCPCELKGKYNGIASGIRINVPNDTDSNLKCSYVKREILAVCKFTLNYNP